MLIRRFVIPLLLAAVALFAQSAQAFFDPPWITPATPRPGQVVFVNIHGGICDFIVGREGFPRISREGNAIRIIEYGYHYEEGDELCGDGVGTVTHAIGAFPPGDYTLTVDLLYPHPVFGPTILNIGVVAFTVAAPPEPVSVPVNGPFWLGLLLVALFSPAVWCLRRHRSAVIVLSLISLPLGVRAQSTQTIQILPSQVLGAPTAAQIVTWSNSSPRPSTPPLHAFSVKAPLAVNYLIPDRATGDFRAWLNANPNSARRKLEDIVLTTFAAADIPAALTALQADPYVANAAVTPTAALHSVALTNVGIVPEGPLGGNDQYGWFDMNLDAAWLLAGGYALVGQIDMGVYVSGAAFRQFDGTAYAGGNLVMTASKDVGLTGQPAQSGFDPTNVDEKKLMYINDPTCTSTPGLLPPANLGHGTHTAGLIAAISTSSLGVQGTCKHCGIAAWKAAFLQCSQLVTPPRILPFLNSDAADRAKAQTVDTGVQVLSMSFGISSSAGVYDCRTAYQNYAMCLAIDYATGRDVVQVASSGNVRDELDFPASDKRVVSAGGFNENLALWDDSPNCPASPNDGQCGSNFSKQDSGVYFTHQELIGSAKRVLSTTYPNTTWAAYAECGDGFGTPMGDGIGWCTGTSMSAPQIAGVVGLLRSINPLAPQSVSEPAAGEKPGLRTVLAQTASRTGTWDPKLGYGIPDAAAAARKVLGTVDGVTVRNRVTPLFRLWQSTTKDFAETTSPQFALSLMINQDKNYVQPASGLGAEPTVPGYTFPYGPNDTTPPATPRAAIYVLTTEYRPRTEWPALLPLYLMEKAATGGKDYMLVTTQGEIEQAHNVGGYELRTIQGYIYQPCTPEPTCVPPGAVKLWREYNTTDFDCAVFVNDEVSAFEAAGYTAACPAGATKMIGYAYPPTDTDHDGLPDGFEYVVGSNPFDPDSDGDGIPDATEFPLAGIATGDPCRGGPLGARNCGADIIFRDGFNP